MGEVAQRYGRLADEFARAVAAVPEDRWSSPSPCEGWTARDVVEHVCSTQGMFLGFVDEPAGDGPPVAEDPVGAWQTHADAVQAVLDDPATPETAFSNPHTGEMPLDVAVDRFYTVDVFMHTWDLTRATGQDDALDPGLAAELLAGMEPIDELLRSSGQYGRRVAVPDDAPVQDRLVAFIGRDPAWRP